MSPAVDLPPARQSAARQSAVGSARFFPAQCEMASHMMAGWCSKERGWASIVSMVEGKYLAPPANAAALMRQNARLKAARQMVQQKGVIATSWPIWYDDMRASVPGMLTAHSPHSSECCLESSACECRELLTASPASQTLASGRRVAAAFPGGPRPAAVRQPLEDNPTPAAATTAIPASSRSHHSHPRRPRRPRRPAASAGPAGPATPPPQPPQPPHRHHAASCTAVSIRASQWAATLACRDAATGCRRCRAAAAGRRLERSRSIPTTDLSRAGQRSGSGPPGSDPTPPHPPTPHTHHTHTAQHGYS